MEVMGKNYIELTDDDMKSITFQVIPQFYWRYEWKYNDFMIHPVGRLNPTNPGLGLYDMLGNVWEWVKDGWTEHVSELDGTTNPMAAADGSKHVIKGGAFDQLVRKVISPSREGLESDKCQSETGT